MGIFFPIIAVFVLAYVIYGYWKNVLYREAFLSAAVMFGFFAITSAELLGVFHALTPSVFQCLWLFVVLLLILFGAHTWRRRGFSFSHFWSSLFTLTLFEWSCVFILLCIFVTTAFIAFVSPPNNYDSMTYHLPRIMHWAAQASLQNYLTDIPRQNQYPPGAEYILLHIFLLTSDDQWFNFFQWGALVGSCCGVSLIARELGAGRTGQLLAAIVAGTVPMAILQSTSTQTDLIESFWLVVAVLFALRCRKNWSWFSAGISAMAFALAVLTKGTFFVAVPVLIWAFAGCRLLFREKIVLVSLFIGILLVVNGSFWLREELLNGKTAKEFIVDTAHPSSLVLNALHQVSMHWILPWNKDASARNAILVGAYKLFNKNFSDLQAAETFSSGVKLAEMALDEDLAGNFVHFFLYLGCFLPLVFFKAGELRKFAFYVVLGGSFFIFFKWQVFISRMHLPVFILFAPVIGAFLEKKQTLRIVMICFLVGSAVYFLLGNHTRSLVGPFRLLQTPRLYYYFMKKPDHLKVYAKAAQIIRLSQCTDVGLIQGEDSWEYPLWALTDYGFVKFHSISTEKIPDIPPCLIVKLDSLREGFLLAEGSSYVKTWEDYPLQIFRQSK